MSIVDSRPQVIDFVMNCYPQGVVRVCVCNFFLHQPYKVYLNNVVVCSYFVNVYTIKLLYKENKQTYADLDRTHLEDKQFCVT